VTGPFSHFDGSFEQLPVVFKNPNFGSRRIQACPSRNRRKIICVKKFRKLVNFAAEQREGATLMNEISFFLWFYIQETKCFCCETYLK